MKEKYLCRKCHGLRNHNVLFEKKIRNDDEEEDPLQYLDEYFVTECKGCGTISFLNVLRRRVDGDL